MPVRLYGATSGYVDITVPDVADNGTVTLSQSAVSPGMVLIRKQSFSGATSVSLDDVFSGTYANYRIVVDSTSSVAASDIQARLRVSGADDTSANYHRQSLTATGGTVTGVASVSQTFFRVGLVSTTNGVLSLDIARPALAAATSLASVGGYGTTSLILATHYGSHALTTAYDGLTLYPNTGTITGDVYVYGYAEVVGDYPQLIQPPGMVLVAASTFSAASSVSVDDCFTSEYANYRLALSITAATADALIEFRVRASGVDDATAYASALYGVTSAAATYATTVAAGGARVYLAEIDAGAGTFAYSTADVLNPAVASRTALTITSGFYNNPGVWTGNTGGAVHATSAAYDGFTVYPSAGAITGSLAVYGYRKAL